MWPPVVIVDPPLVENDPSLGQVQEQLPFEQFVSKPAVEDLHVTVLPRARLLELQRADARPRQPFLDLLGNELGRTTHGEQWEVIDPFYPNVPLKSLFLWVVPSPST